MKKKAKLKITTEDNGVNDPSTVFPSFVKDQFAKKPLTALERAPYKEHLSSFKVIHLKRAKIYW